MKAAARQQAHRKRRRDSGIVGQATTDEPIDTRVRACYDYSTHVLVGSGGGTASVWLATFKPMSCLFSLVVAGALQRPRAVTLRPRPPTAVEAVNLTIHRSHSTAAATNKNTQGTENDSPSPARSNVLRLSLAAGNAPFYTAINTPSGLKASRQPEAELACVREELGTGLHLARPVIEASERRTSLQGNDSLELIASSTPTFDDLRSSAVRLAFVRPRPARESLHREESVSIAEVGQNFGMTRILDSTTKRDWSPFRRLST